MCLSNKPDWSGAATSVTIKYASWHRGHETLAAGSTASVLPASIHRSVSVLMDPVLQMPC